MYALYDKILLKYVFFFNILGGCGQTVGENILR
jgi:hypothetical protein